MEFRLLGPLEVLDDGRPVPLRGEKLRALLAILLLHANETVSKDRLVDELWGEDPPTTAATALRVRVSQLRKALGPGGTAIVTQPPGYRLEVEAGQIDLHRFEELLAAADGADPEPAAATLREALALWRGPALADVAYEPFAQAPIARLEELRLLALERRVDADLAAGRHADLVPELEALVSAHPLRERLRGQLMLALYRSGRQSEALDVYRQTRHALVDELGLEPGQSLQALERGILEHDPALDLERTPAPERSILVAPLTVASFSDLVAIAEPLARHPPRELILAQLIGSPSELAAASAMARERRDGLHARGVSARAAAFTTETPGADLARIAHEQDVDLLLVEAPQRLFEDPVLREVLVDTPCDVAAVVVRPLPQGGSVLVPFTGAEHDWSAVELGAWIARSQGARLVLAGPMERRRDASRLLASASLAVQRALAVDAEPLLVDPGGDGLVGAAEAAVLVVTGLGDTWRKDGLGKVRLDLVNRVRCPAVIVRRGLRPGGLAPPESVTRFTWSIVAR